jgi:hypothetical protein
MYNRLSSTSPDFEGHMMCRLFIAAVLHSSSNIDRSMQFVDDVLENCERGYQQTPIQAIEGAGIAQFIRSRDFMSEGLDGSVLGLYSSYLEPQVPR